MGQVTAVAQVKAHDGVTGLQASEVDRRVGLATTVGLHVGIFRIKKLTRTVARQIFHLVYDFAAPVVALSRVSLRVFIGEHGAHRFHDRWTRKIFGSDEFNSVDLTLFLSFNELENSAIVFHNIGGNLCLKSTPNAAPDRFYRTEFSTSF